jgi:hypothetical protein
VAGKVGKGIRFTGKSGGSGHYVKYHWSHDIPLLVRAMVLADRTLFIAGPPDLVDEVEVLTNLDDPETQAKLIEQDAALEGQRGAILMALSSRSGEKLAEHKLDSLPIFDGMVASKGKLYISTVDGKIVCMGGNN